MDVPCGALREAEVGRAFGRAMSRPCTRPAPRDARAEGPAETGIVADMAASRHPRSWRGGRPWWGANCSAACSRRRRENRDLPCSDRAVRFGRACPRAAPWSAVVREARDPAIPSVAAPFRRVGIAHPPAVGERRDEAVAATRDGGDETRSPVVVLQLDPEAPDVPVDDVALGHEVRSPDRIEDLVTTHHAPGAAGQQVQKALFDPRQVHHGRSGAPRGSGCRSRSPRA